MENKEILQNVVLKAGENQYIIPYAGINYDIWEGREFDYKVAHTIIFSHDFAKGFWGEPEYFVVPEDDKKYFKNTYDSSEELHYWGGIGLKRWEFHLCKMVLEKEPLKYLEKFLKD